MRKQQRIWLEEHTKKTTLPGMADVEPAGGVVWFVDYLREHGVKLAGRAVDIGSGKGRNSVYLAEQGFRVDALEYIRPAIDTAAALAKTRGVGERVTFTEADIDSAWNYEDGVFDIAIDSYSSIDIETRRGREVYCDEMFRTLKPGGHALVTVCSADDEWEQELIAKHPGLEPNSTLWPQTGKFQKDYDESELRKFYEAFEIVELQKTSKKAFKLGREGVATNFRLILRKPQ